jgi:hypothetical protein
MIGRGYVRHQRRAVRARERLIAALRGTLAGRGAGVLDLLARQECPRAWCGR